MAKEKVQDVLVDNSGSIVAGIDLTKLVAKAQASYGKSEVGISKRLATGTSIVRPSKDSDYVMWTAGSHWETLTHLKGIPFGRIVQISGRPDSGKSTHAMQFMKFAQDQDILVILWDAEKKFSAARFNKHIGGNSDKLLIVDTNNITEGAKGVAYFIAAAKEMNPKAKILIVWDSVGASVNSQEDNDENEDYSKQPGVTAKENAFAIRKFNKLANRYIDRETGEETIATLIINQNYANIGSHGFTEKGGSEIYYLSSVVIQLTRIKDLVKTRKGAKIKYGIESRAKVKKNHLFEGDDCISEIDLSVSASGIQLLSETKKDPEIGWDEDD